MEEGGGGAACNDPQINISDQTEVGPDLLVGPHVLLAAETLAAGVAEVEAGHVAPLVDGQVVRLGERPGAPPAVVGLAHRPDLKGERGSESGKYFQRERQRYLQGFFPVAGFLLVHFDTEADCKHLVLQICGSVVIRSPRT